MRKNPYALDKLWNQETLDAYLDMPKDNGKNSHLSPKSSAAHVQQWREWCKRWPKHLWPLTIDEYQKWKERQER